MQFQRYQVKKGELEATVLCDDGRQDVARIIDVSRSGCQFASDEKMAPDTRVTLTSDWFSRRATVRWSKPAREDGWLNGVEFDEILGREIMGALSRAELVEPDRRGVQVDIEAKTSIQKDFIRVNLVNYSAGGYCLESDKESFSNAGQILIRFESKEGELVTMRSRIVWVRSDDGTSYVGCEHITGANQSAFFKFVEVEAAGRCIRNPRKTNWYSVAVGVLSILCFQLSNVANEWLLFD